MSAAGEMPVSSDARIKVACVAPKPMLGRMEEVAGGAWRLASVLAIYVPE